MCLEYNQSDLTVQSGAPSPGVADPVSLLQRGRIPPNGQDLCSKARKKSDLVNIFTGPLEAVLVFSQISLAYLPALAC